MSCHAVHPIICRFILVAISVAIADGSAIAAKKHALLIGCSQYEHESIDPLWGAANDITILETLLRDEIKFDSVAVLGNANGRKPPISANIRAAFDSLVKATAADDQVFIHLSGHGVQLALPESQTDLYDPRNPEPDGFDEAFLPTDFRAGGEAIRDDQIGQWLDKLQAKGAHVWIVFDSCHSGTMMRSGSEQPRQIHPRDAGETVASLEAARQKATAAKQAIADDARPMAKAHDGLDLSTSKQKGSIVAFYAAHDFETAPEVVRPLGAENQRANRHGLLSYHLACALRQGTDEMTYGELGRLLVSRYRAEGRRTPTPMFEGALERQVFGLKQWPQAKPLLVERIDDAVRLTAGELAGVTPGAVLALFRPEDRAMKHALGHVRVDTATLSAASIEAVEFAGLAAPDLTEFPDGTRCKIVSQDLGDSRLRLAIADAQGEPTVRLGEKLRPLADESGAPFRLVDDIGQADWALITVEAEVLKKRLGLEVDQRVAILLPADLGQALLDKQTALPSHDTTALEFYSRYAANDLDLLAAALKEDLRKIHIWQNMWRVATAYGPGSPLGSRPRIQLEVVELEDADDRGRGVLLPRSQPHPDDVLAMRVVNTTYQRYWYTVLFLNGRFGIQHVRQGLLRERETLEERTDREVLRFSPEPSLVGANGFVVIAVPEKEHRNEPNYMFLQQGRLGQPTTRAAPALKQLTTPFETLLLSATLGGASTRSSVSPDNPELASWSWTSRPEFDNAWQIGDNQP